MTEQTVEVGTFSDRSDPDGGHVSRQNRPWWWARLVTGHALVAGTFSDRTRPSGGHI